MGRVIAFARCSAVESIASDQADGQCNDGESNPWIARPSLGKFPFSNLRPLPCGFELIALRAALVEAEQSFREIGGAIQTFRRISRCSSGDVFAQKWILNLSFPSWREGLAEIENKELIKYYAKCINIRRSAGRLSRKYLRRQVHE